VAETSGAGGAGGAGGGELGSLYPFLYDRGSNLEAVMEEVRRSTSEKAAEIVDLRGRVLDLDGDRMIACAREMADRFAAGGKLFAFGNGGSSTDAQDAATLFLAPGNGNRPLPALSLTSDIAVVTALSNDIGFDVVFARQIAAFARKGDIALGLSTSGNSTNLIRAFEEASRRGLMTIGLAGYEGGKMAEVDTIDHLFVVPSSSVHRIQEAQTTTYHVLWELTHEAMAQAATA
jgi:D-sedoheptulose 7-phosphate isomerase